MGSKIFHNPSFKNSVIFLLIFCFTFFFCTGTEWINTEQIFAKEKFDPNQAYSSTEILVKFKSSAFEKGNFISGIKKFNQSNSADTSRIFSQKAAKNTKSFKRNGLDRIFKIKLKPNQEVEDIIKVYQRSNLVEYAEPNYIGRTLAFTPPPDDTKYIDETQWYLHNVGQGGGTNDADVDAPEAWDIQTGDPSLSVAVLDTGIDWDHPDLNDDIWINSNEQVGDANGDNCPGVCGIDDDSDSLIDEDSNGCGSDGFDINGDPCVYIDDLDDDDDENSYPDDLHGWDFVNVDDDFLLFYCQEAGDDCLIRDNNPIDFNGHGTHCSGIAAAETNNNTGVAGIGWDTKIMNVRMAFEILFEGDRNGYWETDDAVVAIAYAVDMGADVISASWGTIYDPETLRDAINYTRDNDVIFVAAAGNQPPLEGMDWEYSLYPAIYNGIIAVAATDRNDQRASFSNYSSWVDISAPGHEIYSTRYNDTYGSGSGTSYSSPLVAGIAALLKSEKSTWNYDRLYARARNRADNIDSQNPNYLNKLGGGRINANKVVLGTDNTHPDGALVKALGDSAVYYLDGGKRHIPSPSVFNANFHWKDIVSITTSERDSYINGPQYMYPDGTLIKDPTGAVYVLEYHAKRHIISPSVFNSCGYSWSNVIYVSSAVSNRYSQGVDFSSCSLHPSGSLVSASDDPAIYLVDNGRKHHIPSPQIFESMFNWKDVITITTSERDNYPDGVDVKYPDGSLLKGSGPEVYVLEYGEKRHITSAALFISLHYSWSNILVIGDVELATYPNGPDIS